MNTHIKLECCDSKAELDRLICRLVAHGSYGASAAAHASDDQDTDAGDNR